MTPLRLGIIGGGRICAAHASSARALPETELAAIAEVDPDRLAASIDRFGGDGYTDYRELLQDPTIDAVVVGLPHHLHAPVAIDALRAGKHVLVEKPMALNVAECDAMLAARDESGRQLMVAHSQHYFPVNLEARRQLREGLIGQVVLATDTWYKPFWERGQRPPWFLDDARGGGMWPMNGSHMIDRLCFLLEDRVVAIRARIGSPIHGLSTDTASAILTFASGLCASLMHVGYLDGVNRFQMELTGSETQLRVSGDGGTGPLQVAHEGAWNDLDVPTPELPLRPGAEPPPPIFAAQLRDFALALINQEPVPISGEYGRDIVRVLEAGVTSNLESREIWLA